MNLVLLEGLNKIKGLKANVASVETNIVSNLVTHCLNLNSIVEFVLSMHLIFGFEQVYFDILEGSHITAMKLGKILEGHGILLMPDSSSRCVTI